MQLHVLGVISRNMVIGYDCIVGSNLAAYCNKILATRLSRLA